MRALPLALCLALAPTLALAESEELDPRGHYIESAIPERSSAFRSVGESTSRTFEKVERQLQEVDGRLAKMALSTGLVGTAAGEDAANLWQARLDARSDGFSYEFDAIQARLNQTQAAYEEAFRSALERALAGLAEENPAPIVPCVPKQGSALGALAAGGPGGGAAAPSTDHCPGTDFSQEIARRWDGDPVLEERLLEIVGGELGPLIIGVDGEGNPVEYGGAFAAGGWPKITTYDEKGAVVQISGQGEAGATWLHPADLLLAMPELAEALDEVSAIADDARASLKETIAGLPRDDAGLLLEKDVTVVRAKARGIGTFTDDARAQLGAAVWASLAKLRKKGKKGGWSDVGLCLNPPGFGGCEGTDVTDDVAEVLGGDKKLAAALAEVREGLKGPDVSVP